MTESDRIRFVGEGFLGPWRGPRSLVCRSTPGGEWMEKYYIYKLRMPRPYAGPFDQENPFFITKNSSRSLPVNASHETGHSFIVHNNNAVIPFAL